MFTLLKKKGLILNILGTTFISVEANYNIHQLRVLKVSANATDQIRIRVPSEVKKALEEIAKVKHTSVNNVSLLLVNDLIGREPGLLSNLNTSINLIELEQKVLPQHLRLISAYSLMQVDFKNNQHLLNNKAKEFMLQANLFIEKFSTKTKFES